MTDSYHVFPGRPSTPTASGRRLSLVAARCFGLLAATLVSLAAWAPQPLRAQTGGATAMYRVTFEGTWTTAVTPSGVPSGAHFTTFAGALHNNQVTLWRAGALATPGLEILAETGITGAFLREVQTHSPNAIPARPLAGGGAEAMTTSELVVPRTHPLLTLASMIAPTPDWFVGVSRLSLLDAQGNWHSRLEVDLFPYDAGTEEGEDFSLTNRDTSPKEVITSIRNMGKFTDEPIARLTLVRIDKPAVILALAPESVNEDGGESTVTATLTRAASVPITLTVSARASEVAVTDDFTLSANRELTIAAGSLQSAGTVTITAVDNEVDSPNKTVIVSAVAAGGTVDNPADRTLQIVDDEATPTAVLVPVVSEIPERGGATRVMATLSPASSAMTTVTLRVSGALTLESSDELRIRAGDTRSFGAGVLVRAVDDDQRNPADRQGRVTGVAMNLDSVGITVQPATVTVKDEDHSADRAALVALYITTRGVGWRNSANWLTPAPISDWYGVTVNDEGRVTELRLDRNNLLGKLPSALGNLDRLKRLHMRDNYLYGSIPSKLGRIGAQLTHLHLDGNQLSGKIPPALGNLRRLFKLRLHDNQLTGKIPARFGEFVRLRELRLDNNRLSGAIPAELGALGDTLIRLRLAGNASLTGCIPYGLRNVPSDFRALPRCENRRHAAEVAALRALYNSTDGANWTRNDNWNTAAPLTDWYGVTVDGEGRVIGLHLNGNNLAGTLPAQLGDLGRLKRLHMSENQLHGPIPSELGRIGARLTRLHLNGNRLSGPIPPELGDLRRLFRLGLHDNRLSGSIPARLGEFDRLTYLLLDNNRLTGDIPAELGVLGGSLRRLGLGSNPGLTGCLPSGLRNVRAHLPNHYPPHGLPVCAGGMGSAQSVSRIVVDSPSVTEGAAGAVATLTFRVSLASPATDAVTVHYADAGTGTAEAGTDYAPLTPGTLTFAPGEAHQTVAVRVLGDAAIEPDETVVLQVSGATGAARIAGAVTGTGTLVDDDVRAEMEFLMAGLARSLGSDAVEVLGARFDAPPPPGGRMTLAGRPLPLPGEGTVIAGGAGTAFHAGPDPLRRGDGTDESGISTRDLLTGSSFELPLRNTDTGDVAGWSLWGRGSSSGFAGAPVAGLRASGARTSGYLGVDYRPQSSLLLGLAISQGAGSIDAGTTGADGTRVGVDVESTSVLPYAHWRPRPGLGVWTLLGAGSGALDSRPVADGGSAESWESRFLFRSYLAAVGGRQELVAWQGIGLAAKADAFVSTLRADEESGPAGAEGQARRARVLLEGSADWQAFAESRIALRLNLGGRWDDDTLTTGFGTEMGGALAYTHAASGLSVEAQGRRLLTHETESFEDWGASLDVRIDPGADGRGLSLSLTPGWGSSASEAGQLHDEGPVYASAVGTHATGHRLEGELAYGFAGNASGQGTVTPFGGVTFADSGASQFRIGGRLALDSSFNLTLTGTRDRTADSSTSHGMSVRLGKRW